MLEARELSKIYRPKKGVPVTALNKISIKFPEKGMIFLLGKSGSGKSTLLNLLGGLDKYDDGEIIIKGVSSKNFKQQYFDSYRNTYVGFIFQEYNILDEFSVGANIALAIELQGRKATDEEISNILKEVDLEGYGNRKPNELSGGQKQRVAIARALVKNPEIIMADEPTGALDSATGKQVFDTLKKLSENKLVIIVSHDREFSEQYADRIIELSDGNIISDVEINKDAITYEPEKVSYDGNTIEIAEGYHLTEEDRIAINKYIDEISNGKISLNVNGKAVKKSHFVNTDESKIKSYDGSTFKLIKSKLPLKSAFKIGASGLKYKKFRLVMTILLSCISFGLFGLADTFGAYNHISACTNSLIDSDVDYISFVKSVKQGDENYSYWIDYNNKITEDDLKEMEKDSSLDLTGVFSTNKMESMIFRDYFNNDAKFTNTEYNIYTYQFSGFAEIDQKKLDEYGYKLLAGKLPDGNKNEMAISEYVFQTFKIGQYTTDGIKYEKINDYSDIIGKTLNIDEKDFTITGVVDTKFNLDRYTPLTESKEHYTTAEELVNYALFNELSYARRYSLSSVCMVGNGMVEKLVKEEPAVTRLMNQYISFWNDEVNIYPEYIGKLSDVSTKNITWIDGEKTELSNKEIIVSGGAIESINGNAADSITKANNTVEGYESISGKNYSGYKIVGILNDSENDVYNSKTVIVSDDKCDAFNKNQTGPYSFVTGKMPEGKENVKTIVKYCYDTGDNDVRYVIQNAVTYELDTVNSILKALSKVFFYIGLGFAIFASLMLANFIGTSISHKKQEIGILRAIGSRSNDVFRIFFSESFIIAMINFILSSIGVFVVTTIINKIIRTHYGILITVLNFGIRQIALLFAVSIVIAAIASFIPVKKIASKRPIDAIRNR